MQMYLFFDIKGLVAEENSEYSRYDFGFPNRYNKKKYILVEVKACNLNGENDNRKNDKNTVKIDNKKNKENSLNKKDIFTEEEKIKDKFQYGCISAIEQ